jgi:hypothetical protein
LLAFLISVPELIRTLKLSIVTALYRSALTIDEFTAARSRLRELTLTISNW